MERKNTFGRALHTTSGRREDATMTAADLQGLIQARYGAATATSVPPLPAAAPPANPTLETLFRHKSVRDFVPDRELPPGLLQILVGAAQSAPTSSYLQTWSVVAVEDAGRKDEIATLCGDQGFIRKAPLFMLFCADLSRLTVVSEQQGTPGVGLEYTEMFLMATIDASLAAQNAALAAESLGLGVCCVGAARNRARELSELLHLPQRVVGVFGMSVGWPDPRPMELRPRLPASEVLHRETWGAGSGDGKEEDFGAAQRGRIAEFDGLFSALAARLGRDVPPWSVRSANRVATVEALTGRHVFGEVLKERGFELR